MTSNIEDAQVDRFVARLRTGSSVRVARERLWRALAEVFPHRTPGPPERLLMLEVLRAAEARGALRLPSPRGDRWDRSMTPAVPASVDLTREPLARQQHEWRAFPWHPQLAWVPQCPALSARQVEFLGRVHAGLVHGDFVEPAPMKYRSLQLTGDEKRLATWMGTSLFGLGRLTLPLLGCLPDVLPLAWEAVGDGGRMVIFENAGPFVVARGVLAGMSDRPFDLVGYGAGGSIVASLGHLLTIAPRPTSIAYVGDLDRAGLEMARDAVARAADLGLPPVTPATHLHRAMLAAATAFGHPGGWPAIEGQTASRPEAERLAMVLSSDLREPVSAIVAGCHRVPEEVLGPNELRAALGRQALGDG